MGVQCDSLRLSLGSPDGGGSDWEGLNLHYITPNYMRFQLRHNPTWRGYLRRKKGGGALGWRVYTVNPGDRPRGRRSEAEGRGKVAIRVLESREKVRKRGK